MHRRTLIAGAAMISAVLAAAPAASAQTEPFNATYTAHGLGPTGHPTGGLACPADAFTCGSGTADGFGAFTTQFGGGDCDCVVRTLTFSDGSTLVLDEDPVSFPQPGGSGSAPAPNSSEGHPTLWDWSWNFDRGTGRFAGVTGGSGDDDYLSAGMIALGTLSGTLTTS
jgi:hypothetical protein